VNGITILGGTLELPGEEGKRARPGQILGLERRKIM